MYTDAQLTSIRTARQRLFYAGKPEVRAVVDSLVALDAPYDEIWKVANADAEKMVKPEKVTDIIPPPPFTGRGSSREVWLDFAKKVSDIEPEILVTLGRNDIITILVDRGIIQGPDYDLDPFGNG